MNKYDEMSDFEINKAIADWIGYGFFGFYNQNGDGVRCNRAGGDTVVLDYPNNPDDMWPIIVENDIDVISPTANGTEYWEAHKFFTDVKIYPLSFLDKNPLRAAAIVFLMMKDAE